MKDALASRSIQRDFRRQIWAPFCRAVETYRLIRPGDRIAVCYSGGKDSSLLACCVRDYQAYGGVDFSYEILMLDPGYEEIVDEDAPKALPVTGQIHWPIAALGLAGCALLIASAACGKKREENA